MFFCLFSSIVLSLPISSSAVQEPAGKRSLWHLFQQYALFHDLHFFLIHAPPLPFSSSIVQSRQTSEDSLQNIFAEFISFPLLHMSFIILALYYLLCVIALLFYFTSYSSLLSSHLFSSGSCTYLPNLETSCTTPCIPSSPSPTSSPSLDSLLSSLWKRSCYLDIITLNRIITWTKASRLQRMKMRSMAH